MQETDARNGGTVGKALEVLDQVAAHGGPVRFAELLRDSPFPKATLYRLLQTLIQQDMLQVDSETGAYRVGVRLVRLAHSAWRTASLAPLAQRHLDDLAAQVCETVHLAQLDNAQVLYIDKRNADVPVQMYAEAGKIGPAYCTGVGKAMLAFLPADRVGPVLQQQSFHRFTATTLTSVAALQVELAEIRACGHAFDREEHEPGIICVAMPILTQDGQVLGGLSVTATTLRRGLADLETLVPHLRSTVRKIADDASIWRFPGRTAPQLIKAG